MERPNAWKKYDEAALNAVRAVAEDYRGFISQCKTERECAAEIVSRLEKAGYVSLDAARAASPEAGNVWFVPERS